jgi:hypothetical protein
MKQAEYINENLMNYEEAASDADRVANPEKIEGRAVATPDISGKDNGKCQKLGDRVAEEELEGTQQSASEHENADRHL